jgi:hypothetical protein
MPPARGNLTNLGALDVVKHDRIDKGRRSGLLMHVGGGWAHRGANMLSAESGRLSQPPEVMRHRIEDGVRGVRLR